jgi:hypothetical protein
MNAALHAPYQIVTLPSEVRHRLRLECWNERVMYDMKPNSFENLKWGLLLRRLNGVPDAELHPQIFRAVEEATTVAHLTPFPALVFPCLFEEMAQSALENDRQQLHLYWCRLQIPALGTIPVGREQELCP